MKCKCGHDKEEHLWVPMKDPKGAEVLGPCQNVVFTNGGQIHCDCVEFSPQGASNELD